jgi:uncharacterized protein (DUF58 family)
MARPTGRGSALLAVTGGTYLAARMFGTWELYLLTIAFLAALVLSWIFVAFAARKLTATRTPLPERPTAGDPLLLTFRLTNGSWLPGLQVTLHNVTGDLNGTRESVDFESLGPRAQKVAELGPRPARRGIHALPSFGAEAEDPLGLIRARRTLGDPLRLTVYPRLVQLRTCALFAEMGAHRGWGRLGLPTLGGAEFRSIRPHYPGEPLNHVDWKATARTGNLMLREMDDPTSGDITMLLEGTGSQVVGELPETNFDLAVQAAGSVADFALRAGRGVSLLRPERRWRRVRLSPDTDGRRRLLESLAEATPSAAMRLGPSLRTLLANGRPLMRARTLVFVVLQVDRELVHSLSALREEGSHISVIHVAADSFTGASPTDETRGLLLSLATAGVRCLTIGRNDDLYTALSLTRTEAPRARILRL